VAFAAGFASVRQFNDTVREVFALTPRELRRRRGRPNVAGAGTIALRLAYRAPLEIEALLEFFASRAISGVEEVTAAGAYRRTLRLPHGTAIAELAPANGCVRCSLRLGDVRDLGVAVARCRRLLDLDADPASIADVLARDALLGPLVAAGPGLRVPGCVDGTEIAVRAGARPADLGCRGPDACRRLVQRHRRRAGRAGRIADARVSPAAALALADDDVLAVPAAGGRRCARSAPRCATAASSWMPERTGSERAATSPLCLESAPGRWNTSPCVRSAIPTPSRRAISVCCTARALGVDADAREAERRSQAWRPFRAYTVLHLWRVLHGGGMT
jgi:AraC family transcriptional regulator of adaptative response / DNA-3-methyladenine glycosylase II